MCLHKEEVYFHQKYLKVPFVVISGPSAGGKTTLSKLAEDVIPKSCLLIKHTDRKPRSLERNFKDYFFVSSEEFEKIITNTTALIKVYRYEHLYGLCISEVERCLNSFKIPVFILDPNAALEFKKIYSNSILVFVGPYSIDEVRNRIIERKNESIIEIKKRLNLLEEEYQLREFFDVNDYCINSFSCIKMINSIIERREGENNYDFK